MTSATAPAKPAESAALPLAGRRILITRAPHQASALAAQLEALGATPILIPTIEIAAPETFCTLDAGLLSLAQYDWLIVTSVNGVEALHRRAQQLRVALRPRRIAAIGPATADALRAIGLAADLIPDRYVAEALAEALVPDAAGRFYLLVRAAEARDTLPEALEVAGGIVTIAAAYRNCVPAGSIAALASLFSEAPPEAVTFTSASTARNLATLLDAGGLSLPAATALASIGPITSQAMRELGLPPHLEATESTIPSLVAAIVAWFSQSDGVRSVSRDAAANS